MLKSVTLVILIAMSHFAEARYDGTNPYDAFLLSGYKQKKRIHTMLSYYPDINKKITTIFKFFSLRQVSATLKTNICLIFFPFC